MSIIYALIAKNEDQVLCEFTEYKVISSKSAELYFEKLKKILMDLWYMTNLIILHILI